MNEQNSEKAFPKLNFYFLRIYANRWAKLFTLISEDRIVLYRYHHSKFPRLKYCFAFEIEDDHPEYEAIDAALRQARSISVGDTAIVSRNITVPDGDACYCMECWLKGEWEKWRKY